MENYALPDAVLQAIHNVFPGYEFRMQPVGFGWARDRHFRCVLARHESTRRIVVKHSWSESGHYIEKYLYESVLPKLRITTARLYATVDDPNEDTPWLVLEDIGSDTTANTAADLPVEGRPVRKTIRQTILRELALIHATGASFMADRDRLGRFPVNHGFYETWNQIIEESASNLEFEVPISLPSVWRKLDAHISDSIPVLIHGDTDLSNFICVRDDIGIIDWERACFGPAILDIGRIISMDNRYDEIMEYRQSFNTAGYRQIDLDDATRLADYSVLFEAIRWVCYYIDRSRNGSDPGVEWHASYYRPAVDRIRRISEIL